ncbi:peptidylprolyl isomerase [Paenibacillus koleovorans]|uniref:peptidylprolyl isomerase n=1 Tax=Paenibacillus koleovorans TaxID=121608 RepID=UPI000FDA8F41|nr:peptidylprolyl isomerase [Paenibacillus koleovorans]
MNKRLKQLGYVSLLTLLCVLLAACGSKPESSTKPSPSPSPVQGGAAPSAITPTPSPSAAATPKKWSAPPAMTIDTKKTYEATFDTNKGSFKVQLFADTAPQTVNNFIFLSKEGFYNNVTFHRIMKTFMIQTGDPLGTGSGGPGYNIPDELKSPHKYDPGIVAMANTGQPNSGGSQFFICTGADCAGLNSMPNYTIFGKVSEGMDIVQKIAGTAVKASSRGEMSVPTETVKINSISVKEK